MGVAMAIYCFKILLLKKNVLKSLVITLAKGYMYVPIDRVLLFQIESMIFIIVITMTMRKMTTTLSSTITAKDNNNNSICIYKALFQLFKMKTAWIKRIVSLLHIKKRKKQETLVIAMNIFLFVFGCCFR